MLCLQAAAQLGFEAESCDATAAFLQADAREEHREVWTTSVPEVNIDERFQVTTRVHARRAGIRSSPVTTQAVGQDRPCSVAVRVGHLAVLD